MIFQEPMTSLSPVHSIGTQIVEAILLHDTKNKTEAKKGQLKCCTAWVYLIPNNESTSIPTNYPAAFGSEQ